jgi:hypothetical protein
MERRPQNPLHRAESVKSYKLREMYGARCLCCGWSEEDGAVLTVDHVLPRVEGGSDETANLQLLCAECNFAKAGQHLDFRRADWQKGGEGWSAAKRAVRSHLVRTGKFVARHPGYRLPSLINLYIQLWECRNYSEGELEAALTWAEAGGYSYPKSVEMAHAYLDARYEQEQRHG